MENKVNTPPSSFLLFSFFLSVLHLSNPAVLSFLFYSLLLFRFLLSFFPPITELGPGYLDQCHHSGWQRGRAQRFPGWLSGLCGCLSSFWAFAHWFSPHLSGELTKEWKHIQEAWSSSLKQIMWHWVLADCCSGLFSVAQMIMTLGSILLSPSLPTNYLLSDYWF